MAFDKYVKLRGSERKAMPGAIQAGSLDPNEPMRVTLTLRSQASKKQPSLVKLVASGQRLTREEYAARYGADAADIKRVAAFAAAHGLAVAHANPAARTVVLTGRTADFAKAFQVELARYEHAGGSYRGRTGAISLPQELSNIVSSVHGLDNRPQAKPHYRPAKSAHAGASAAPGSYTTLQVAQAYNFPAGLTGAGQTIGIIELGGGFTQSDLNTYFSGLNISPAPTVIAVSVDGAQNQPTGDTNGPDTEVMLDIEVAGAVAPGAEIVVYFAPNTDAGFLDAINQAVMDTVNKPAVISISWGGPESSWTAQSLQTYNSALQSASAVGVTVCVAAGDNGSTDGVNDGLDHVDFPASSPYALACGGTTLNINGGTISSEVVWNDLSTGEGATGGGISETFPIPSWQANASVPPSDNPGNFVGRGLPDVAGDADPNTGYQVQVDGSGSVVGGTSAVAPLWAGLLALFNQSLGTSVGYLNPNLYQTLATVAGTFNDITSGNNGDYSAGPGWDPCSGWGSPNGSALLQAIRAGMAPAPAPAPAPAGARAAQAPKPKAKLKPKSKPAAKSRPKTKPKPKPKPAAKLKPKPKRAKGRSKR